MSTAKRPTSRDGIDESEHRKAKENEERAEHEECPVCLNAPARVAYHANHKICVQCALAYDTKTRQYRIEKCPICREPEHGHALGFLRFQHPPVSTLEELKQLEHPRPGKVRIQSTAGRRCAKCKYSIETCNTHSRCFACKELFEEEILVKNCEALCTPIIRPGEKPCGVLLQFAKRGAQEKNPDFSPWTLLACRCGYPELGRKMFLSFGSKMRMGLYHIYPQEYCQADGVDVADFLPLHKDENLAGYCDYLSVQDPTAS